MEKAHGTKCPDYAQYYHGQWKQRPSNMPEEQEKGHDHQHAAQGEDGVIAGVRQLQNSLLK